MKKQLSGQTIIPPAAAMNSPFGKQGNNGGPMFLNHVPYSFHDIRLRTVVRTLVVAIGLAFLNVSHAPRVFANDSFVDGFRTPPDEARPTIYWLWLNGYVNRDHVATELKAYYDAGIRGVCIFDMGARGDKAGMPPAGPAFMSPRSVADIAYATRVAKRLGMTVQLSVASSWDMGADWVKPPHASMGLFTSDIEVTGPQALDQTLPFPVVSARTPKDTDGKPVYFKNVAVLALPASTRQPGHDFVFRLDPAGVHTLDYAILYNTRSEDAKKFGDLHLFAKDFSIAVSTTTVQPNAFHEVFSGTLQPKEGPQRFALPKTSARYARLRLLNGYNPRFDRIELGEFELFDADGVNVVASHAADRSRDGADLVSYSSALGQDTEWTAGNIHDGAKSGAGGSWSSTGPPPLVIRDPKAVIDITDKVDDAGRVRWNVPDGNWVVKRFVCTNTGETLKVPSPNSNGLATDHFSRDATRVYLKELIKRLKAELGDLGDSALQQLYLASYEVRGAVWTPDMLNQFHHYRGYDMTPYLPALAGTVVVDQPTTERFLYDYRKTLGDVLVDAYYREAVNVAHASGLGVESEAGGPGPPIHQVPVDALKAQGAIDEIRGEFWPKRPDAHALWVVKETACAGHVYGKRRIHMEAFTSMFQWQDGPFDLKPAADRAFCEGMNHVVWHTASHLPKEAGKPGWVYYAGTHLNTNVVWWPQANAFLDYLARCSYLLQQGLFVGDVCYYYGDQGYNFVPPKHVDPELGFGYDYDVANPEIILTRMTVKHGRIVLPDGMSYAMLVLPKRDDIDLDVLKKLERLVQAGATIIGPKPSKSTGLTGYPARDEAVQTIADRLWGPCDGRDVREHAYGEGRVIWGRSLRDVLNQKQIRPDFTFSSSQDETQLDYIHRQTNTADVYFVRNKNARWESVRTHFRVRGRVPELWNPATGEIIPQFVYQQDSNGIQLPLQLPPHGSVFVVFREASQDLPTLTVADTADPSTVQIEAWDGHMASVLFASNNRIRLTADDGRSVQLETENLPAAQLLTNSWNVRFVGPGAPVPTTFERLSSWTDRPDANLQHFSGHGIYTTTFSLSADWLARDRRVRLDLGDLWAIADVTLNGHSLGVLWKPPFIVDITDAAVAGKNTVEIAVANTWSNRLVGDSKRPREERVTQTNVLHNAGRLWKDVPLKRSGLFGPVRLIPIKRVAARLK